MKKINIKDIDFSILQKLQSHGTQSTIYTDGNLCYKLLDGFYPSEKKIYIKNFLIWEK